MKETFTLSLSSLQSIVIPYNVDFVPAHCFSSSDPWVLISFESDHVSWKVEMIRSQCLSYCENFSSVSFESNSSFTQIEENKFSKSSVRPIPIP
jgi:hypothetical protein